MRNVRLSLGGVTFRDFEIPEKINFRGTQRLASNLLIGGGRVVAALGSEDEEISFSGIFSGPDAALRAKSLDNSRSLGFSLPLVWDEFYFMVIISKFEAEYRRNNFIPFALKCEILTDASSLTNAFLTPLQSLISSDMTAANSFALQAGIHIGNLHSANSGSYVTVQSDVVSGLISSGDDLTKENNDLVNVTNPMIASSIISSIVSITSKIAALSAMNGYLARAAINIGDLSL